LTKASALRGKTAFSAGAVGGAGQASSAVGKPLGSWGNSNLSGGAQSLGAKLEAEKRFNEEKAAKEQAQSATQAPTVEAAATKEDDGLNPESCYTDEHMAKLEALSAITNIDLLQDFTSYIRDSTV